MIERRPVLDFVSHAVLIVGVAIVAFPVFIALVMSTQTADQIASSNPLSLVPGGNIVESYRLALMGGKTESGSTIPAGWRMLVEGLIDMIIGHDRVALMGFQPTALGLFGERADEIRSMAMVRMAIWEPSREGLLAFGSSDENGFTEDMGVELVAFLARVVERTAERWPVL